MKQTTSCNQRPVDVIAKFKKEISLSINGKNSKLGAAITPNESYVAKMLSCSKEKRILILEEFLDSVETQLLRDLNAN